MNFKSCCAKRDFQVKFCFKANPDCSLIELDRFQCLYLTVVLCSCFNPVIEIVTLRTVSFKEGVV